MDGSGSWYDECLRGGLRTPVIRCAGHEHPYRGAVSTGQRNTLVFLERWSVNHGVPKAEILQRQAESGDLGSLAARRVDELDWAAL